MSTPQCRLPSSSPSPLEPSPSSKEAPFLDMVLECDQDASMNDSFSTLGLHSIFSEDEIRSLEQQQQQQKKKKQQQQQHALSEKIVEEDDDNNNDDDKSEAAAMDLRTLLQRGNQIIKKNDVTKSSCCVGDRQHLGNRWLESAGKSVSCRNLGYEASAAEDRPSQMPLRVSNACKEIVSQALELTDSPSSSLARSASHGDLFARSHSKATQESRNAPPKPQPIRIGDRWASDGGRIVMSQSCRHLGVSTTTTRDSGVRATTKALDVLTHRNSVAILPNESSPDKNRKTMLTLGKSLSARNINDLHSSSLSPSGLKRSSCRLLAVGQRSKSVRHMMDTTAGSINAPAASLSSSASALKRQQSAGSLVQVPPAAASFNGRKFVSYSRSLSCRDFSDCNRQTTTTTTTAITTSTPQSPGASRWLATTTATTKTPESPGASRWLASPSTSAKASVLTPPTREVTAHRRTTGNPHQRPKLPFSLEDDDDDDDSSHNKSPSNTSSSKATARKGSLSNYLEKQSQDDSPKQPPATTATRRPTVLTSSEACPRGRRGVMAKSMSARHVVAGGGRGNRTRSLGKSLSARNLAAGEEESLPTLSTFSTIKSPATPRSKLSRCSEEDSLPTLLTMSTISTNPSKESPTTPVVKSKLEQSLSELDSLPGLSPMSKSPSMPRTSRLAASLSAIDLKSKDDSDSLPHLSPISPFASKSPTTAASASWKPSTSALHAISPPLATCEEDEAEDQSHTTGESPNTKPSAKEPSSGSKKDTPVFSTEEILKEIGSILDMPTAGKKSDPLAPIQEVDDKDKPAGRPSLASSRRAQSCRHLSSTKEASQKSMKASSGHGTTPLKSSRHGMKKEGSKRKLLSSSSSKQGGSSRNLTKSSREKSDTPPEKQRSSRNLLQKSARKQKSSRKLMASGGEEKTDAKPGTSRSALKKEGSKRGLLPSSSHLSSDSNRRRSPRAATRESRAKSPSCVALYYPGKKEEEEKEERPSTPPKPDTRRTAPSKKSSMGSHSSGGSGSNKRLSTSSCLKSSSSHSENNTQCSTLRESTFNSSFRERCNRFQCTWSGEQPLGEMPSSERTE